MENSPSRGPVTAASKEAQVILPPPSPTNPVPTLPAALRLDNNEQLLTLLQTNPAGNTPFRQLLVFADDELRTLLLRQVVTDPNTRVFKGKKNWDAQYSFVGLPRSIIGTRVMPKSVLAVGPKVKMNATLEGEEVSLLRQDESWDDESVDVITYFLRASALDKTAQLLEKIRTWKRPLYHRIVYLPQPTAIVQKMWSGLASTTSVSIHKLQLDLFPLESDVLSLEYTYAMKETEVDRVPSTLITTVARSLLKIQDVVGTIPRVQSLGPLGEEVVHKMMALRVEEHLALSSPSTSDDASEVDAMIIMDRKVDLVTPMVTPLTYEGLLDDVVGIDSGFIKVDVNILNPDEETQTKEIVSLAVTGSDTLYAEVRDQHVEKFGSFLQNQAKALRESHANFTNKEKKKDLSEIHQFVKQIPVCCLVVLVYCVPYL